MGSRPTPISLEAINGIYQGTFSHSPDVVLLELGQNRRDLLCRQPAERSSKPPEEDDDTGLILPDVLEGCLVLGDRVHQLNVGYL